MSGMWENETFDDGGGGALEAAGVTTASPSVTPSEGALGKYVSAFTGAKTPEELSGRFAAANEASKTALQKAIDSLTGQYADSNRYNQAAGLAAMASGFLAPTRAGSFGESLGAGLGQAAPALQSMAQQGAAHQNALSGLQSKLGTLDADSLTKQLSVAGNLERAEREKQFMATYLNPQNVLTRGPVGANGPVGQGVPAPPPVGAKPKIDIKPVDMGDGKIGYQKYENGVPVGEPTPGPPVKPQNDRGAWEPLNDTANLGEDGKPTPYLHNRVTNEFKTLDGQPYVPKSAARITAPTDEAISDEAATRIADQYLAGDKQASAGFARSKTSMKKIGEAVARLATERGMNGPDIARTFTEMAGQSAGQRTLGTRSATVEMLGNEVAQMAPIALAASEKINRTDYPDLNSIIIAAQKRTGGEDVVKFGIALNSLVNTYAKFLNPTGVPTDADKSAARDKLNEAYTKGQFKAAIDMMKTEIEAGKKAISQTKEELGNSIPGAKQRNAHGEKPVAKKDEETSPPALYTGDTPPKDHPTAWKGNDGVWRVTKDGKQFKVGKGPGE